MMNALPWHDWQFWVVTLAALASVIHIARSLRFTKRNGDPICGRCGRGATISAPTSAATVRLTIDRRTPQAGLWSTKA